MPARLQPNGIDVLAGGEETRAMFPCVAGDVKGVLHGIHPIVTSETKLLNMIVNLV